MVVEIENINNQDSATDPPDYCTAAFGNSQTQST